MIRTVLDTNVVLAANFSAHPQSPNVEIISRWRAGQFVWLVTADIMAEYAEKMVELGKPLEKVEAFVADVLTLAEEVPLRFFHLRHYPVDGDDIAFVLCALNGTATHLVTYDVHLHDVGLFYLEYETCEPLEFLACLRQ